MVANIPDVKATLIESDACSDDARHKRGLLMKPQTLKPHTNIMLNGKKYFIEEAILQGGSGEVYKISKDGVNQALKLYFPFYRAIFSEFQKSTLEENFVLQIKEYQFLSQISHPNIVKVIDHGSYKLRVNERNRLPIKTVEALPFLIEEFIDGEHLGDALREYSLSADDIVEILVKLTQALQYLHVSKRFMHTDIKSSNVVVRQVDHQPILVDFGLSKNFDFDEVSRNEITPFGCDWDLLPAFEADHPLKRIREKEKSSREELYELAFPTLDLFDFGKMLDSLGWAWKRYFELKDRRYIEALIEELTNWDLAKTWNAQLLHDRIVRLAPKQRSIFGVEELTPSVNTEQTIMIPPDVGVPITPAMERILNNRSFRRLFNINQLNLMSIIYPAADYKRSVHVLSAYQLAREYATRLYSSPLFRLHMDDQSCQKLLATVLAHDINHFPFLHIFQEANIPEFDSEKLFDRFCDGQLTGENQLNEPSLYDILGDSGLDRTIFKRLLINDHADQHTPVDQIINSFLNSGADIDKMSYLFLDGYFTGVKFGSGIDFTGLLKSATVAQLEGTNHLHLAYGERGIQAAENVVMTRYWNFRSIYWHHTNRAVMAMLLHVVRELYRSGKARFQNYLEDTLWMNDVEAVTYLDSKYRSIFYKDSILHGFPYDRQRVYRRLYTVRAGGSVETDNALFKRIKRLDYNGELRLRAYLAENLRELIPASERKYDIGRDDVLIDIPRREMDSGGKTYISIASSQYAKSLEEISKPVAAINMNYELLTKRIRFFINPSIGEHFSKEGREDRRPEIYKMISTALEQIQPENQVI